MVRRLNRKQNSERNIEGVAVEPLHSPYTRTLGVFRFDPNTAHSVSDTIRKTTISQRCGFSHTRLHDYVACCHRLDSESRNDSSISNRRLHTCNSPFASAITSINIQNEAWVRLWFTPRMGKPNNPPIHLGAASV